MLINCVGSWAEMIDKQLGLLSRGSVTYGTIVL